MNRDIETARALNIAARRSRFKPTRGPIFEHAGRTVYLGEATRPYGRSINAQGYLTHCTGRVYLAWIRGRLVGQLARWRCGGGSMTFTLLDEPTSPMCAVCFALTVGRTGVATLMNRGAL